MLNDSKIQESKTPQNGSDYSAVVNPYNIRTYNETGWDKFVSSLGFRSAYDKAEADRLANYNIWESKQAERQRQEMYNSASEVKQREESAGFNPALSGQTLGGGSSDALSSAPASAVSPEATDVISTIANIGQLASGAVSSGLNIALNIAQIRGARITNDTNLLQQYLKLLHAGEETVFKTNKGESDFISDNSSVQLDPSTVKALNKLLPRRLARKLNLARGLIQNSDYGKGVVASVNNKSADEIAKSFGSQPVVSGTRFNRELGKLEPITDFVSKVADIQCNYAEKIYTDMAQLRYNREKSQFEYEISSYDFMKGQKELMNDMFSVTREMIAKMRSRADGPEGFIKWLNQGMLVGLSTLMSGILPNISVGSSHGSSSSDGRNSSSFNSSNNFGISW